MENNNDKVKIIAAQALADKYGFCPAFERVKLLESSGDGDYILFCVGTHEYRLDNGELISIEDQTMYAEAVDTYFQMFHDMKTQRDSAEDKNSSLLKRVNEFRFENRRLKDANKRLEENIDQLTKERNEYIKLWLSVKEERDELKAELARQQTAAKAVAAAQRTAAHRAARLGE